MSDPVVLPYAEFARHFRERVICCPLQLSAGDTFDLVKNAITQTINGDSDNIILCGHSYDSMYAIISEAHNGLKEEHWPSYAYKEFRGDVLVNDFERASTREAYSVCQCPREDHFCISPNHIDSNHSTEFFTLIKAIEEPETPRLPLIILIKNFEAFTNKDPSTMYNLFNLTKRGPSMPVLVIGMTTWFDPASLFEKRVKSRFSHRVIILKETWDIQSRIEEFKNLFTFKDMKKEGVFTKRHKTAWNKSIDSLLSHTAVTTIFKDILEMYPSHRLMRTALGLCLNRLGPDHHLITLTDFSHAMHLVTEDSAVLYMIQLPPTYIAMVISILMAREADPAAQGVKFEPIYYTFNENVKGTSLNCPSKQYLRWIVDKLADDEYLMPKYTGKKAVANRHSQIYELAFNRDQVEAAIALAPQMPAVIKRWAQVK